MPPLSNAGKHGTLKLETRMTDTSTSRYGFPSPGPLVRCLISIPTRRPPNTVWQANRTEREIRREKKDDSNLYKKGMRNEETRVGNTLHSPPVRPEGRIVFLLSSSISNGHPGFPRGRKQAKSFVGKCVRRTGCCAKGRLMWTESSCNRAKLSSGYRAVCELNLPLSIIS